MNKTSSSSIVTVTIIHFLNYKQQSFNAVVAIPCFQWFRLDDLEWILPVFCFFVYSGLMFLLFFSQSILQVLLLSHFLFLFSIQSQDFQSDLSLVILVECLLFLDNYTSNAVLPNLINVFGHCHVKMQNFFGFQDFRTGFQLFSKTVYINVLVYDASDKMNILSPRQATITMFGRCTQILFLVFFSGFCPHVVMFF